jgi:hypothetical protein
MAPRGGGRQNQTHRDLRIELEHVGDGVGHQGHQAVLRDGADQNDDGPLQDAPEILRLQDGPDTEHRQGKYGVHRPTIQGSERPRPAIRRQTAEDDPQGEAAGVERQDPIQHPGEYTGRTPSANRFLAISCFPQRTFSSQAAPVPAMGHTTETFDDDTLQLLYWLWSVLQCMWPPRTVSAVGTVQVWVKLGMLRG